MVRYNLNEQPFQWLMWEPNKKTMLNGHKITIREVLLYMVSEMQKTIRKRRGWRDTGAKLEMTTLNCPPKSFDKWQSGFEYVDQFLCVETQ